MSKAGILLLAAALFAACCVPCGAPEPTGVLAHPLPLKASQYKVVAVQVDGLYNKDGTGFFPKVLQLIGQRIGQDLTNDLKVVHTFEEAVTLLKKDYDIFAGAVESNGIYAKRINFTVPFLEMHIVSAFNSKLNSQQQDKLNLTALDYTGMPETIEAKPKTVKKLSPVLKALAAKGKANKVVNLDVVLKEAQDGKSIFIGRTPVLDNKLLGNKFPDVKLECQSRVRSSFGVTNDATLLNTLNNAISQLQKDGSLAAAYTASFPASLYVQPSPSDADDDDDEDEGSGGGGSNGGNGYGGSGYGGSSGGNGNGGSGSAGGNGGNGYGGSGPGSSDDRCSKFAGHRYPGTRSAQRLIEMLSRASPNTLQQVSNMIQSKLPTSVQIVGVF